MAGFVDARENQGYGRNLKCDGQTKQEVEPEKDSEKTTEQGSDCADGFLGGVGHGNSNGQVFSASIFKNHVLGGHPRRPGGLSSLSGGL